MTSCPACSKTIPNDANFCLYCGVELDIYVKLMDVVEQLASELGHIPDTNDMRDSGEFDPEIFYGHFDGWDQVIRKSSINVRELLIEDIREVADELEKQPSQSEFDENGRHGGHQINLEFDNWQDAIDAADVAEVSDEILLAEIQRLDEDGYNVLNTAAMREEGKFSQQKFTQRFGSWKEALTAAGIDRQERLLEDIRAVAEEVEGQPTTTEYNESGIVSSGLVTTEFGSWGEAMDAVGIEELRPDREQLIQELQRLDSEVESMKATVLPEHSEYSVHQFTDEFGSWTEALTAAGIDRKRRFLDDLLTVATDLGGPPNREQYMEYGKYTPGMLVEAFGSWQDALKRADIPAGPTRDELINELQRLNESYDVIKARDLPDDSEYTVSDLIQEFGSWEGALEGADIDRSLRFRSDLLRVAEDIGELPDKFQYTKHGQYSHTDIVDEFGTWVQALAAVEEVVDNLTTPDTEPDTQGAGNAGTSDPGPDEEPSAGRVLKRMKDEFGKTLPD